MANQAAKDVEILQRASKARAYIVRQVSSAVVHISVEHGPAASSKKQQPNSPDEFMRRFFPPGFQPQIPNQRSPRQQRGLGAGFVVSKKGYILTNNHVIQGASVITVKTKDGREMKARVIGTDPPTDLAVVKVSAKTPLKAIKLGDSDKLEVGETVFAIGNPFGLEQTVTQGIVSAKGRSHVGVSDYEDFIQTDASINPGNSGGPLINLKGEVVGVNTAIITGRFGQHAGIGFAIPMKMARQVMEELIANGKVVRGFLGVVIQNVDKDLAKALKVKAASGVLIARVGPSTPASKAGLQQGDVITHVNGVPTKSVDVLRTRIAAVKPGRSATLRLLRDGRKREMQVTVGQQPANMRVALEEGSGRGNQRKKPRKDSVESSLGLRVRNLGQTESKSSRKGAAKGVLVAAVKPGGPAAEAGLRRGMVIQQVNRRPVRNTQQFQTLLRNAKSGSHVLLLVLISNNPRYISLEKP